MSGVLQALVEGLLNPLTTPAHVLSLLALGLLLARQPHRFIVLLLFALALTAGFLAIVLAIETTPARTVLLAAAAALGVMVATAWAPKLLAWLLAVVAGAALALDSPPQAVTLSEAYATIAGTALGVCALLVVVAVVAGHANAHWQRLGVRIIGSWIAASAILVLAVQLR